MHVLTWLATTVTPTPSPSPTLLDPDKVTPGVAGFIAIAVIAIAVVLLLVDMLRRIRRGRYRAEIAEQLDAESRAESDAAAPHVTPEDPAKD
jgi:hypothetical protein